MPGDHKQLYRAREGCKSARSREKGVTMKQSRSNRVQEDADQFSVLVYWEKLGSGER
jgi:hypothetical protein